jgi:nitrogen fixation NifU-like protein
VRYSPIVLDHFLNPRNAGLMREPDGVGEDEYEGCGDLARFFLRVVDGCARELRFQTYGCGPTIAASSAGTELIRGAALEDLLALPESEVEAAVGGLPPDRLHAAGVVSAAIRAAVRDAVDRRQKRPS